MPWYENTITREIAEALFAEIEEYTYATILNEARDMRDLWPLTFDIPTVDFTPKGVIVHISRTPSMWNALKLLTRNVYGAHFLVMSGRHTYDTMVNFPLLAEIPAAVFMPFHPRDLIQHSGYISPHTFGIELRSVGMLRPYLTETEPPPLLPIEATIDKFEYEEEEEPDLFMPFNLWRERFHGPTYLHHNTYHELPTRDQIVSMLVLMKALNAYTDGAFERQFIMPANCVHDMRPILPCIPWDLVRKIVVDDAPIPTGTGTNNWIKTIFTSNACVFEAEDLEDECDGSLGEQLDPSRWRGHKDIGELITLFQYDRDFQLSTGYKRVLTEMGYQAETKDECDFAMILFAIARNLGQTRESDIYNRLQADFGM